MAISWKGADEVGNAPTQRGMLGIGREAVSCGVASRRGQGCTATSHDAGPGPHRVHAWKGLPGAADAGYFAAVMLSTMIRAKMLGWSR
ncbi:hypothetical protein [Burkholderia pseudomallei]|nr:hypothetical protein [Burkholderia pseudomallei]